MDRFNRLKADKDGAVNRRTCRLQYANHRKRVAVVFDKADTARAVRDDDFLAQRIAQLARGAGPDHGFKHILKRPA